MCPKTSNEEVGDFGTKKQVMSNKVIISIILFCGSVTVASLVAAIILADKAANGAANAVEVQVSLDPATISFDPSTSYKPPTIIVNSGTSSLATAKPPELDNPCQGSRIMIPNAECVELAIGNVKPQAGGNVTKGYKGSLAVDHDPIKTPYWMNAMCPVNVHWHLGAEHYSAGEYDEFGTGPQFISAGQDRRDLQVGSTVRGGYQCNVYDIKDIKFTRAYDWKHCVGMLVGETYEVHWPHSHAGACGTPNQYQTPFYDGVFCNAEKLDTERLEEQIGVQAQVFTVVNDEAYYYPDLFRGMIVDGDYGQDIAMYTGSTTGTTRNNTMCSGYSPITWQVDRKCQLISASSFDKMCADMKAQRDDMSGDLFAHGARELVNDEFTADNHNRALLRGN